MAETVELFKRHQPSIAWEMGEEALERVFVHRDFSEPGLSKLKCVEYAEMVW